MKLALTVKNGSLAGRRFEIEDGFLTIGRDANCGVRFQSEERIVSSRHAYIEKRADGFYITDNQSTNGTFLNNARIETAKLNSGDTISFGPNGYSAAVEISFGGAAAQVSRELTVPPVSSGARTVQTDSAVSSSHVLRQTFSGLGITKPPDLKPVDSAGRYLGIAITIFVVIFLAMIVILMVVGNLGVIPAMVAAVIAFVPAVFYLLPVAFLDRYDPEPPWLLALAFSWGALVAVIVAAVINEVFALVLGEAAAAVISAPLFEEGAKGFGIVLVLLIFRREFDDILDGIVYAATIALGFATVENVLYYGRGLLEGGAPQLLTLFVLRGILSPFAHVTFTSMTGIGCGIARESHNSAVRLLAPVGGYICAVALHALWNGLAVIGGLEGFLVGYVILEVPFFLIFVGFASYIMRRQNKILRDSLAIDVARGLITKEQYATATSAFKSTFWILGSLGSSKFKARRKFLRSVGKLGLTYWHIQRATAAQGQTGSFQQNPILRDEVLKWRDKV